MGNITESFRVLLVLSVGVEGYHALFLCVCFCGSLGEKKSSFLLCRHSAINMLQQMFNFKKRGFQLFTLNHSWKRF